MEDRGNELKDSVEQRCGVDAHSPEALGALEDVRREVVTRTLEALDRQARSLAEPRGVGHEREEGAPQGPCRRKPASLVSERTGASPSPTKGMRDRDVLT
jgi:hypothetical protein